MYYRVEHTIKRGSGGPSGWLLPGKVIDESELGIESCNNLVESGFLTELHEPKEVPKKAPEKAPEPAPSAAQVQKSKVTRLWRYDPDTLKDMSLQQLNIMVYEIDPSMDPLKSKEAAISKLSSQFIPEEDA